MKEVHLTRYLKDAVASPRQLLGLTRAFRGYELITQKISYTLYRSRKPLEDKNAVYNDIKPESQQILSFKWIIYSKIYMEM